MLLAKEITARFHGAAAADAAEQDFDQPQQGRRARRDRRGRAGGRAAGHRRSCSSRRGLAPSTSEASRLIEGGGVRVDRRVVSDKGLKLEAGTYVVQVGKRKFARVTLA